VFQCNERARWYACTGQVGITKPTEDLMHHSGNGCGYTCTLWPVADLHFAEKRRMEGQPQSGISDLQGRGIEPQIEASKA
jgi:hypothetical protein